MLVLVLMKYQAILMQLGMLTMRRERMYPTDSNQQEGALKTEENSKTRNSALANSNNEGCT